MTLWIPIGPPGCGKSYLAEQLVNAGVFNTRAVVSTDAMRQTLCDDHTCQEENASVFELTRWIAGIRLRRGLDVWYDATNLTVSLRCEILRMAPWSTDITTVLFTANDAECRRRNSLRVRPVPDEIMDKFLAQRRENRFSDLVGTVTTDATLRQTYNLED